ncbi:MAG: translocation/assembly module TamB [Chitinispirillia bacterium]|nr:translocation/assembly module TamB [Chitinispirillia bacterium]MCL2241853.1 translocation/assembly module TamB [Chitinispirillia bacterium]
MLKYRLKLAIILPSVIVLSLAVLLFVLSLVSYYVICLPSVQERAVRFAEEQIQGFFHGDITVERVESNLLSYVNVYGLRAVGRSEHGDSIYVGHVRANYWIPALLFKRVRITSARVTDVHGHIVMEPDSRIMIPFIPTNYYEAMAAAASDSAAAAAEKHLARKNRHIPPHLPDPGDWEWKVLIGRTRIDGINAVYRDFSNDMVGEIRNASARARFYSLDSFSVVLRVPGGSYTSPWWSGDIDTIGASCVITWRGIDVQSLLLRGSGTRVTAGGRLSYFADGPWDLRAEFITSIKPVPILYQYFDDLGRGGFLEGTATYKGKLFEPVWAAQVRGSGVTVRGYELSSFDADAVFGRDEYGHARIRGACDLGRFDVTASIEMKNLMDSLVFGDYSAIVALNRLDVPKVSKELNFGFPLAVDKGDVRVRAVGRCFEIPTSMDLTAELSGAELAGGNIGISSHIKGNSWTIDGSWGGNRVKGNGSVNLATGALNGDVNADMPDPSAIVMTLAKERVRGSLTAAGEFGGNFNDPANFSVSAELKGDGLRWRGINADSIEAHITLGNGKLNLRRADGIVSGWVDSIAPFFKIGPAHGYVRADFSMRGGFESPAVSARFRGRALSYGQYALDTASGFASLENSMLRWNNLYLRGKGTSLYSSGRFKMPSAADSAMEAAITAELFTERKGEKRTAAGKLDAKGTVRDNAIDGECRITSVPLDIFDPWIPEKHRVKGVVSLTGDFSGTPGNPAARVNFRLEEPSYSGHSVYSVIGDAMLSDSLASAAAMLRVGRKSGPVELKARVPLLPSEGWKIDGSGGRRALVGAAAEKFNIKDAANYLGPGLKITGAAAFDVSLSNVGHGWGLSGNFTLPAAEVKLAPQNISVSGLNLNAGFSGTPEKPDVTFTAALGGAEMPPLRVDGGVIRGRMGIDTLSIDFARFVFRDGGSVNITAEMLHSGRDSLFYNRNFYAQYRIDNLPTALFSRLVQTRLNNGLINGSGVVYGMDGRPWADGTLSLSGLELALPDITPNLGPINASLRLHGNIADLDKFSVKWGRGAINGSGRVFWGLDGLRDMDLRVNAAGLDFELPEVVSVGVQSATLRINDRGNDIIVSGRAALAPTAYTRDLNVFEMADQMRISSDVRRAPNPFLQSVLLRVDLDLANNMNIDMNMGTLLLDGRITIGGTADEPGIVGEIRVRDGFVYYLDRKFMITEGTLFNPEMVAINPNLKITAKSDVVTFSPNSRAEQFTITLNLTGTLESPVVRFTSEPALSELDILSILTFGERMGGMGSDFGNRALNLAAQPFIGLGARRLEKMLNLDRVSVSGDVVGALGGGGQGAGATIGVSKRITSRLNVTAETNTVKLTGGKVTAQYRLLPNLYLEGQTTSDGENALDLIFRYSR